jgi:hypothetical protein
VTLINPGRQHAQPPVSLMAQVNGDVTWLTRLFKMTDEAGEIVFEGQTKMRPDVSGRCVFPPTPRGCSADQRSLRRPPA